MSNIDRAQETYRLSEKMQTIFASNIIAVMKEEAWALK